MKLIICFLCTVLCSLFFLIEYNKFVAIKVEIPILKEKLNALEIKNKRLKYEFNNKLGLRELYLQLNSPDYSYLDFPEEEHVIYE